ncbi:NAD(P)-binding protein [Cadophora sp. DSE1049]|nr:NAD(P)-binding protein [Cadophora sp. DSE1049]
MTFNNNTLILVTGGNGHVAQHVLSQLLSHPSSPKVCTTVRSPAAAAKLQKAFPTSLNKLEIIQIPDISVPGAFDTAIEDVTHIAHIASPLVVGPKNVEEDLLIPAIQGTTSILNSAAKQKSGTLKHVVITSSFAAVFDAAKGWRPGYAYGPEDWNPISYEEASGHELDLEQWPETWRMFITYMASKALAEKAAWDFYNNEKAKAKAKKGRLSWGMSVVCPTYIGGPFILDLESEDDLSFSNKLIWKIVTSGDQNLIPLDYPNWVDVRDVADVHIRVLEKEVGEERFILTNRREGVTYVRSPPPPKYCFSKPFNNQNTDCKGWNGIFPPVLPISRSTGCESTHAKTYQTH